VIIPENTINNKINKVPVSCNNISEAHPEIRLNKLKTFEVIKIIVVNPVSTAIEKTNSNIRTSNKSE
jgi:hypothetical protein